MVTGAFLWDIEGIFTEIYFMFDETQGYKHNDHFFCSSTVALAEVCNAPDKDGVFVVYELKGGRITLVYIGRSVVNNLRSAILHSYQFGLPRKKSWPLKMLTENIDALDVYWWVTNDLEHSESPEKLHRLLIRHHLIMYGELPRWNQEDMKKKSK